MDRAALAFGPAEIGLWRMISGAATLAAYCLYARKWSWLTATEWRQLAIVAFFCNAYPYVVQPFAMQSTGEHGFIGMMVTLVPIATIASICADVGASGRRRDNGSASSAGSAVRR